MGVQADIKDAVDGDRGDLIEVLASHHVLPVAVDRGGGSSLLGKSTAPIVRLERDGQPGAVDRQTTVRVVDALGLDSEAACEAVRDEIESHAAW